MSLARREALLAWRLEAIHEIHRLTAATPPRGLLRAELQAAESLPPEARAEHLTRARRLIDGAADASINLATEYARSFEWSAVGREARLAMHLRGELAAGSGLELRPSARAVGLAALSDFMIKGNSPQLRARLEEAIAAGADTPGLRAQAARLHVLAGHPVKALELVHEVAAPPWARAMRLHLNALARPDHSTGWLPFPCNYYTYRYSLISNDQIGRLLADLPVTTVEKVKQPDLDHARDAASDALRCHELWNFGNQAFDRGNYLMAMRSYVQCYEAVGRYFKVHRGVTDMGNLVIWGRRWTFRKVERWTPKGIFAHFRERYQASTLDELHDIDWKRPLVSPEGYRPYESAHDMLQVLTKWPDKANEKIDAPLATMYLVFLPLAIAEAAKMRRRAGDSDSAPGLGVNNGALARVKQSLANHDAYKVMSQVIEWPFALILKGQILLGKGDASYAAREADTSPSLGLGPAGYQYQGLKAARHYQGVLETFRNTGAYVTNVQAGANGMSTALADLSKLVQQPIVTRISDTLETPPTRVTADDGQGARWVQLPYEINLPSVDFLGGSQPRGLGKAEAPFVPLITIGLVAGSPTFDRNPAIYALVAQAEARLRQLAAGLNYLGYADDMVPSWRFSFLLERARYFATHATHLQSQYRDFLAAAEREEFQEQSAGQTLQLEQGSVAVASARVGHAQQLLIAAQASEHLGEVVAKNAHQRYGNYVEFDRRMDQLAQEALEDAASDSFFSILGAIGGAALAIAGSAVTGGALAVVAVGAAAAGAGGISSAVTAESSLETQLAQADAQRALEKRNLALAEEEAKVAKEVATQQRIVAEQAVVVANLERTVAAMRHEYARQTLWFLRNRTVNAELWFRLADQLRGVSDTYLQYAVSLSFLAEQALEFESGRRRDVIRFDYGFADLGDFIGADFLLRDLDTLEHGFITDERLSRQHHRVQVSLRSEFPVALQELRASGATVVSIPLAYWERRHPGAFNVRIDNVQVVPVALVDPTRFTAELTHLGSSSVRVPRATYEAVGAAWDRMPGGNQPSWCADPIVDDAWPVLVRVSNPETRIVTGTNVDPPLSTAARQAEAQERGQFEGLGAAGSWRIDLGAGRSPVDLTSVTDVLLVFDLAVEHSDDLRRRIAPHVDDTRTVTRIVAARTFAPAEVQRFKSEGTVEWTIERRTMPLGTTAGRLRNVGVALVPDRKDPGTGRIIANYDLVVSTDPAGSVTVETPLPEISIDLARLQATCSVAFDAPVTSAAWGFGERPTTWVDATGPAVVHTFATSGPQVAWLQVVHAGALHRHRVDLAVSATRDLPGPLRAVPAVATLAEDPSGSTIRLTASGADAASCRMTWTDGREGATHDTTLDVGLDASSRRHLRVVLVRDIVGSLDLDQRHDPSSRITLRGLATSTDRTFDDHGAIVSPGARPLSTRLFGPGEISPLDRWSFSMDRADNPWLESATANDVEALALEEIVDVALVLEYDVTDS